MSPKSRASFYRSRARRVRGGYGARRRPLEPFHQLFAGREPAGGFFADRVHREYLRVWTAEEINETPLHSRRVHSRGGARRGRGGGVHATVVGVERAARGGLARRNFGRTCPCSISVVSVVQGGREDAFRVGRYFRFARSTVNHPLYVFTTDVRR